MRTRNSVIEWVRSGLSAAGIAAACLATVELHAGVFSYNWTARDFALLPEYCKYTQTFREYLEGGDNPSQIQRWTAIMGPAKDGSQFGMFNHMHHYCQGLMFTNHAALFASDSRDRLRNLELSIKEFDYVLKSSRPDFKLLPEILTKKGENLIKLNRGGHAIAELKMAIKLKADYWPPYAALSDLYVQTGDQKAARELLEQGLSHAPDATSLKRRLANLEASKGKSLAAPKAEAKPVTDDVK